MFNNKILRLFFMQWKTMHNIYVLSIENSFKWSDNVNMWQNHRTKNMIR